jgi:hypothetical protein
MTQSMLDYLLRESAEGIRIMARDSAIGHTFNYGEVDGIEYSFLMVVVPTAQLSSLTLTEAKPLSEATS